MNSTPHTSHPKPQTTNSKPRITHPTTHTPNPKPQTSNPKPQIPHPTPQTPNHKSNTSNPKPQTRICRRSTRTGRSYLARHILSVFFSCHVQPLSSVHVTKHWSSPLHRNSLPSYLIILKAKRTPTPSTLNPQPSTLHSPLSTLHSHSTLNPQPSTLHPPPSTCRPSTRM